MKYLVYLLGFLLLIGAVYYFVWGQSFSTLDTEDTRFAIRNSEDITRIVVIDQDKAEADLQKQASGRWSINGRYYVREDAIEQILKKIKKTKVYAPVPQSTMENVMKNMRENSKSVSFYKGEELLKTIVMSGNTLNKEGTYMMLAGTESPYITHVPGHKGFLQRFYFTNIEEWRTREAFDFTEEQIKSIGIEYSSEKNASFLLENGKTPSVAAGNNTAEASTELNRLFIKNYINSFENVNLEAFDNSYSKKEEIKKTTPYCTIKVEGKNDESRELILFRMPVNERSKKMFDSEGTPMEFDSDHYYVSLNDGKDFGIIQTFVFTPILKKYNDFFQKTSVEKLVN